MVKDVIALAPAWGYLQVAVTTLDEKAFIDANHAAAGQARLTKDFDGIFELVKAGRYDHVLTELPAMSADADKLLAAKEASALKATIALAAKFRRTRRRLENQRALVACIG